MITDFHSHILPGLDDGSVDAAQSRHMLIQEAEQLVRRVVATPHFYPHHDDPRRFLEARAASVERLYQLLGAAVGFPKVVLGAEVYFFRGISDSDFLDAMAIGRTNCVMIEMPLAPWPEEYYRELGDIRAKRGLTPVIAHIDRYIRPLRTFSIPERLEELPVLVQANGEFFRNRTTSAMALGMLKRGQIHLLGSDCHNTTSRKPDLGDTVRRIERKLGPGALEAMEALEETLFG